MEKVKYFGRILGVAVISLISISIFSLIFSDGGEGLNLFFGEGARDIVYQYLEIGTLLFIIGYYYIKKIPREKTGLYLLACGVPFFTIAHYSWGLGDPVMWYFYYFIIILLIFLGINIFDNIKKKFIEEIVRRIKEDNK